MVENNNHPELQILKQLNKLELQLTIAMFLAGLSKTRLTEAIHGEYNKELHDQVTTTFNNVQKKLVKAIQDHWDDETYQALYAGLREHLAQKKSVISAVSAPNEHSEEHPTARREFEIFRNLSRLELKLAISIFLNGFSKTELVKSIFEGEYKVDDHVRVTDMLSGLQNRIAEILEKSWDDRLYNQLYSDLTVLYKNKS